MGVTFKRDKDGNLVGYKNGKKIGTVGGLGDLPTKKSKPERKAVKTKKSSRIR